MKKIIFFMGFLISVNLAAQKPKVKNEPNHDDRPVHFGFSLGFNTMDFRIRHSENLLNLAADVVHLEPGFQVHAISNFRMGRYFDFRILPGISFGGARKINYSDTTMVSIESNFIEMPLLFKYKGTRINNFRPYVIGGTNLKFDLASTKKVWGEGGGKENYVLLNSFDYYLELGVGFDFYLEYFKFAIELKYGMGMLNMLKTTKGGDSVNDHPEIADYTNAIDRLNSRMFMISFHFE